MNIVSGKGPGKGKRMTVEIDGRRVPLSADGISSVKGDGREVAGKLVEAMRAELTRDGHDGDAR